MRLDLLKDDAVLDTDKLGYVVFPAGSDRAEARKDLWVSFTEIWAEWAGSRPEVTIMTWRVPSELVDQAREAMLALGLEPIGQEGAAQAEGLDMRV